MATPSILMWEKVLPKPPQSQNINIDSVVHPPGRSVWLENGNGILTGGLEANIIAEYGHGCLAASRAEGQANHCVPLLNLTNLRRTCLGSLQNFEIKERPDWDVSSGIILKSFHGSYIHSFSSSVLEIDAVDCIRGNVVSRGLEIRTSWLLLLQF